MEIEKMSKEDRVQRVKRILHGKRQIRKLMAELKNLDGGFVRIFLESTSSAKFFETFNKESSLEKWLLILDFRRLGKEDATYPPLLNYLKKPRLLILADQPMRQLSDIRTLPHGSLLTDQSDAIYSVFRDNEEFKYDVIKFRG